MSPYRRNVLVGAMTLLALGALGWMILQFGETVAAPFAARQIPITLVTERADGVSNGSQILFRGVGFGRVVSVHVSDDLQRVRIDAMVNIEPALPANLEGVIRTTSVLGSGAAIELALVGDAPQGTLASGAQLTARYAGLELVPPEFSAAATELQLTIRQLRESNLIANINDRVTRLGLLLDSTQELLGDEAMRADLRASLASLRSTTERADRIAGGLETFTGSLDEIAAETRDTVRQARGAIATAETEMQRLSRLLSERLQQAARLLDQVNAITARIESGEGTLGQLINDPRLYASLVEASQKLDATLQDVQRVVQQIEQEGVSLRVR